MDLGSIPSGGTVGTMSEKTDGKNDGWKRTIDARSSLILKKVTNELIGWIKKWIAKEESKSI